MPSFNVTRRALSLNPDARDSVTKWQQPSYTNSTIKACFDPAQIRMLNLPASAFPTSGRPMWTGNYVREGDQIIHPVNGYFLIETVKPITVADQFVMYACTTSEIPIGTDRPATSGTWHTDSQSIKTDPRNRIMAWVDSWISYTAATAQGIFAGVSSAELTREFTDNGIEVLTAVDDAPSIPVYDAFSVPYKFEETVNLHCMAMDTSTKTAVNILENYEQAIRDVATDHGADINLRQIESTKPERFNAGGKILWQQTIIIRYTRWNDDYTPTYPRVTWGPSAAPSGTFTFPVCIGIDFDGDVTDVSLKPPGYMGMIKQGLGDNPLKVTLTCDLDFEPLALTWKRPQTTTPKTDDLDWQVILDIKHNSGLTQNYQTLTFDWGSFQVRYVTHSVRNNILTVTFEEYTSTSKTGTYTDRYGIT